MKYLVQKPLEIELLSEMNSKDTVRNSLFIQHGKITIYDLQCKKKYNFVRRFCVRKQQSLSGHFAPSTRTENSK